jgi:hypothetical protein
MMKVSHYPVQPGLFAGEYPGHQSPNVAETRLRELVGNGVRTFIDLTSQVDGLTPYEPLFIEIDDHGSLEFRRHSFEIPDMNIPSGPDLMRGILDLIRAELEADRTCYVHCWGGIGRTGTATGCWLRECGLDPDSALARVQHLYGSHMDPGKLSRYPYSPQQPTQVRYVRNWPEV